MGKVRKIRRKYHLAAAKGKESIRPENDETAAETQLKHVPLIPPNATKNETDMDWSDLMQKCQQKPLEADRKSVISLSRVSIATDGTGEERKMKKKDKLKLRRQTFLHKIQELQIARNKEASEKKKIQKLKRAAPLSMDLLLDALPTTETILKTDDETTKPLKQRSERKQKGPIKYKAIRNQMLQDVTLFRRVLQHPAYKADPDRAIAIHLQNTLK